MSGKSINQIMSELIDLGDTPIHSAILSLIFTSGLKSKTFRDFKIKQLVSACDDVFDDDEPHDIVTLLNKDSNRIFCCWEYENNSKYQITFSTPETTRYIFNYLNQAFDIADINEDDYLFQVKNKSGDFGQMRESYVSDTIGNKVKSYNKRLKPDENHIRLTERRIGDYFKSICEEHLYLDDDKDQLIDLFLGIATDDNKFYKMYKEDKNSILDYYKPLLPYLEIKHYFEEDTLTRDMEDTNLEDKTVKNIDSNYYDEYEKIITEYYMEHIKNSHDAMYGMELKNWVYRCAKKDYDAKDLHDAELCCLFKKAEVTLLLEDKKYLNVNCSLDEWDKQLEKLMREFNKLGLDNILGTKLLSMLGPELMNYYKNHNLHLYYRNKLFTDHMEIIDALCFIIDQNCSHP